MGAGLAYLTMPFTSPMYIVGEEQSDPWQADSANPILSDRATFVDTLEDGVERAIAKGGTDKVLVFDGSYGHLTCSPSMAAFLRERAPIVDREVEGVLLPRWLAQRGLS